MDLLKNESYSDSFLDFYNNETNSTTVINEDNCYKPLVFIEMVSLFYFVGIVGSFLAILHLYRKKNFKNTKQALMLRFLMTLEFIGLAGMVTQMFIQFLAPHLVENHIWIFCFLRILCRFFGLCSGYIAFLMAIERYFALTKPFLYCKHFTNGLMKRLIFILCTLAGVLTFAPVVGFGVFIDNKAKKCERYRDATKTIDVAYAYLFFIFGTVLCVMMIICNVSVTRKVYRSYRNMKQLTLSSLENFNRIQSIKLRHQVSEVSTSSSITSKSFSIITRDEIEFINMVNMLTASFVLCWGASMITIPIAQFVKNPSKAVRIIFRCADVLLLLHFTFDPYIYVLCRTDYWLRIKNFMKQICCLKENEFAEFPKMDQERYGNCNGIGNIIN
ncbi:hypothetical protein PVAND_010059 [Polypedilum vanderplanki]|uniref:G-protein coupled receptors family 1 profile domain-containing protein n=1 Tax=Polypedilum vanderplanki TaxID=319348 RepID=A0A9J6CF64_POLVA|nr:hypothetical protein PVAND_010059 [Polypedilum vanderplanki]